jgi:hypothetical protein
VYLLLWVFSPLHKLFCRKGRWLENAHNDQETIKIVQH